MSLSQDCNENRNAKIDFKCKKEKNDEHFKKMVCVNV